MKKLMIMAAIVAVILLYSFSVKNTMVDHTTGLEATVQNNEQILSTIMMTLEKVGSVVKDNKEFQKEMVLTKFKARYGQDGVQGVMTWIQEASEPTDVQAHKRYMNTIDAELKRFEANQTTLLDKLAIAKRMIEKPLSGFFLKTFWSYNMESVEKYRTILKSKEAGAAFDTGSFDVDVSL